MIVYLGATTTREILFSKVEKAENGGYILLGFLSLSSEVRCGTIVDGV